nr:hypothetical protein [uncultured Roseibium sp.]
MKMSSNVPARKVTAAALGSAFAQILFFIVNQVWPQVETTPALISAVTILFTFAAGYFTPPSARDTIVQPSPSVS